MSAPSFKMVTTADQLSPFDAHTYGLECSFENRKRQFLSKKVKAFLVVIETDVPHELDLQGARIEFHDDRVVVHRHAHDGPNAVFICETILIESSLTRFGEISPLRQKFKRLW